MTYEKLSQKKKAQMNLENCRYLSFMMAYATLDSTQKNCFGRFTDGEDDGNSFIFLVGISSVAVLLCVIKGNHFVVALYNLRLRI